MTRRPATAAASFVDQHSLLLGQYLASTKEKDRSPAGFAAFIKNPPEASSAAQ